MPFRLEAAKDDYRIHCEELEKQLIEVQHRNDELTSLAEESRALKDELDVLRFISVCVCLCVWRCILIWLIGPVEVFFFYLKCNTRLDEINIFVLFFFLFSL